MNYCDVSLPVPLDQSFTYRLPETLRHRVQPGCRVLAPFGARRLTGVVVKLHDQPPEGTLKEVLRLVDEEPVLDAELLALGGWISQYYCAPLGEVLRSMTPLSGEVRKSKLYSLTDSGRDAARQLVLGASEEDATVQVLQLLEARPLSASYLERVSRAASWHPQSRGTGGIGHRRQPGRSLFGAPEAHHSRARVANRRVRVRSSAANAESPSAPRLPAD
jgi:primosomal protein N' (replication factor Y)